MQEQLLSLHVRIIFWQQTNMWKKEMETKWKPENHEDISRNEEKLE